MKRLRLFTVIIIIGISLSFTNSEQKPDFNGKTITIEGTDGIKIHADIYDANIDENLPIILLFHQAGYSRGEYRSIAPKLNELGYACISIDQRSGNKVNGIINETHLQAVKNRLDTKYIDALPDLRATIDYALEKYQNRKVILWGSSYSSSLIFILGTEYKNQVKALLAFSPGEYFSYQDKEIKDFASLVECPVFITSSGTEKKNWESIYEAINSKKYFYLPDFKGKHGSKALWESNQGNEKYWNEVKQFLKNIQ
ncbi:MAG: alpha/beta fold hydrolase [Bacteroidales bacterium]|nr:alpha/beta fold hydrolase [Bacteroidales bacterium]